MVDLIDDKINSLEFKGVFINTTPLGFPVARVKFKNLYKPITLHGLDDNSIDTFFDKGDQFRSLVMKKMFIQPCSNGKSHGKKNIFETNEMVDAFTKAYHSHTQYMDMNSFHGFSQTRDEFCHAFYRIIMYRDYPVLDILSKEAERLVRIGLSNLLFQSKQRQMKKDKYTALLKKAVLNLDNVGVSHQEIHDSVNVFLINKMMDE